MNKLCIIVILVSLCSLLTIDESIVYNVSTIAKMRALFDNYKMDVKKKENITPYKLREDADFLNAVLDTKVMQTAMHFLHTKGISFLF